ncbi:MAG: septum formation initiator family protein [Candidatus Omnitrophica bacterium]|nr:septum formation initiator family protein [Candidatus Omnitrophota bacterium]
MRKPLLFLLIALIVLLVFFWIYFPAISRYRELKIQEDKITRDITDLDQRIEGLLEERRLLKNDLNYLEKVIREELGLVKPGEIIYKMIPEAAKKTGEETAPPAETPPATPAPVTAGQPAEAAAAISAPPALPAKAQ